MPFAETSNGKRLFYVHRKPDTGAPDLGITILMIHGLGSSHSFYMPLLPSLLDAGFSCLVYDTHGSALSNFSGVAQDVKSMAEDALSLMAVSYIAPERTIVVGHSMGGMVACTLASQHPFAGVVLLGPVHPTPQVASIFAKRIETVEQQGMEAMADAIPGAATGSKATPTQQAFIRSLLLSQQPEGYVSLCNVIAEAMPPEYGKVASPLLIVAGAEDKSAPLPGCQTILDSYGAKTSMKKIEVLSGVGHWHCVEAADEVVRSIQQFAKQIV